MSPFKEFDLLLAGLTRIMTDYKEFTYTPNEKFSATMRHGNTHKLDKVVYNQLTETFAFYAHSKKVCTASLLDLDLVGLNLSVFPTQKSDATDNSLDLLKTLVDKEGAGEVPLSTSESALYVNLVDYLKANQVDIPFEIEV